MKTIALLIALAASLFAQEERIVIVPPKKETPPPLFYSATATVAALATLERVTSTQDITFTIVQGKPETLSLSLSGEGDVVSVTGDNLRDWSVRSSKDGSRFLDIRPILPADGADPLKTFTVRANTVSEPDNGPTSLLLPGPGPATGFSLNVSLDPAPGTDLRITNADGLAPLESGTTRKFITTTASTLSFTATPAGTASKGLELLNSSLTGKLSTDSESITFTLTATARSGDFQSPLTPPSLELLSGNAALTTPQPPKTTTSP